MGQLRLLPESRRPVPGYPGDWCAEQTRSPSRPLRMASVPLQWWASKSQTATRRAPRSRRAASSRPRGDRRPRRAGRQGRAGPRGLISRSGSGSRSPSPSPPWRGVPAAASAQMRAPGSHAHGRRLRGPRIRIGGHAGRYPENTAYQDRSRAASRGGPGARACAQAEGSHPGRRRQPCATPRRDGLLGGAPPSRRRAPAARAGRQSHSRHTGDHGAGALRWIGRAFQRRVPHAFVKSEGAPPRRASRSSEQPEIR